MLDPREFKCLPSEGSTDKSRLVTIQEFTFPFFRNTAPDTLAQVSPTPTTYETGTFDYSATGDVTGVVVPIDLDIPPAPGSRQ